MNHLRPNKLPDPLFSVDMMSHILCWLPVKTLVALRCVSKLWCSLIDSTYFVKLHLECSIATSSKLSLIFNTRIDESIFEHCYGGFYSLDFDRFDKSICNFVQFLDNPVKDVEDDVVLITRVIGSCKGLLLLVDCQISSFILWNPSTRKYQKIPELPLPDRLFSTGTYGLPFDEDVYGFGYDQNNQFMALMVYKLLWIVMTLTSVEKLIRREVHVCSLKNDSWRYRVLDFFPYDVFANEKIDAVHVNNVLHWIGYPSDYELNDPLCKSTIVAFNLGAEECRELPPPDNGYDLENFGVNLSVFGGSLSLTCIDRSFLGCAHVWVMKIYGIKESWTKLFTVKYPEVTTHSFNNLKPVAYSKSRDKILLVIDGQKIIWYDLKRKIAKNVEIYGANLLFYEMSQLCVGSLVPLNGESAVTGMQAREENNEKNYEKNSNGRISKTQTLSVVPYSIQT